MGGLFGLVETLRQGIGLRGYGGDDDVRALAESLAPGLRIRERPICKAYLLMFTGRRGTITIPPGAAPDVWLEETAHFLVMSGAVAGGNYRLGVQADRREESAAADFGVVWKLFPATEDLDDDRVLSEAECTPAELARFRHLQRFA